MKSRLGAAVAVLIFSFQFVSLAQEGFHVGITGSFNSVWIISQNNFEILSGCSDPLIQDSELAYELTFGFTAGGMMGYNFTEVHGLTISMQYSKFGQEYQDGFTTSFCPEFSDVRRSVDLRYFQIPVQYKLTGGRNSRVRPFSLLGVQFGFLGTSDEMVSISGVPKEDFQVSADEKFRNFDFGLAIDGGIDVYLADEFFISAGLTTYFGLTDINGSEVRDFISLNDDSYRASRNYKVGIHLGLHYFVQSYRRRGGW